MSYKTKLQIRLGRRELKRGADGDFLRGIPYWILGAGRRIGWSGSLDVVTIAALWESVMMCFQSFGVLNGEARRWKGWRWRQGSYTISWKTFHLIPVDTTL